MMLAKKGPPDLLNTVHIKDEECGEVSRAFALRWKDELYEVWHLLDCKGKLHSVKYNMDLACPTITEGWTKLKDYYRLTGNHQMNLLHFGNSLFLLTVYKSSSLPQSYPKWHSQYHQNPKSVTFRVLLNEYKATCSSLDVPSPMYSFLKDARFTHVNVQDRAECKIVYNDYRKSAKIGSRWRTLAKSVNLEAGQEITFEFPNPKSNFAVLWIDWL